MQEHNNQQWLIFFVTTKYILVTYFYGILGNLNNTTFIIGYVKRFNIVHYELQLVKPVRQGWLITGEVKAMQAWHNAKHNFLILLQQTLNTGT